MSNSSKEKAIIGKAGAELGGLIGVAFHPPDHPPKESQNAAGIAFRERQPPQQQPQVTLVRAPHFRRGVFGCLHRLIDDSCQKVKGSGGDSLVSRARLNQRRRLSRGLARIESPSGQLVKTDGDRLAKVHGGLMGAGGNFDDHMAAREVVTRETTLFRTKDESGSAAAGDFIVEDGSERRQGNGRLPEPAAAKRCGAGHETAIGNGFGKAGALGRPFEQLWRTNGGTGFAPMGCKGRNHGQTGKSEIGHGPG